jgi:hypothetical protein
LQKTLIVAYETADRASAAVRALRQIGIPPGDIKRHPVSGDNPDDVAASPEPPTGSGFFTWLFGHETVEDRIQLYKKALDAGGTIITVQVSAEETASVHRLLQDLGPVDWEVAPGPVAWEVTPGKD